MDNCIASQQTLTLRTIAGRSLIDSNRRTAVVNDLRSSRRCLHVSDARPRLSLTVARPLRPLELQRREVFSKLGWRPVRVPNTITASGASQWQSFSTTNLPLGLRSQAAKGLAGVFQNDPYRFNLATADALKSLADDLEAVNQRMILAAGSPEACLHRRIAELKERQCQVEVEDIMYLLICYKFAEIRVHLIPKLSQCIYNGRLEISPSKDFALESPYSSQVLEIVREYANAMIGLKANSSANEHWKLTTVSKSILRPMYLASILYGYFLKSAMSRLELERCLASERKPLLVGQIGDNVESQIQSQEAGNLRCFVKKLDADTVRRCAKPRSKEATSLMKSHTSALFGDTDEAILTSFSSLKRLVLEAVVFGSFLWDSEECVNNVYELKDY